MSIKQLIIMAVTLGVTAFSSVSAETVILKNRTTGKPIPYGGSQQGGNILVPTTYKTKPREFRGTWVATVEHIDFGKHTTADSFKKEYLEVVNNLASLNFNAMMFQVRPTNDAFYASNLNPWSKYLTGKEGVGIPNFDPMTFMVEEAHKRGIEFHAWLNPYRVVSSTPMRKAQYLATLAPGNFARRRPDLVLEIPLENNKYQLILNPGEPEVINFVVNTVKEIIQKYPVDAIHFDDYFYPYTPMGEIDIATYRKYNKQRYTNIDDWRRGNVDTLIYYLKQAISQHNKTFKRNIQLGISPFGIWANKSKNSAGSLTKGSESYYRQHADTRGWVKRGWIDYIVPQLYWPFNQAVAPYAALADWWAYQVNGTNVKLYIGVAGYRMGNESADWKNVDELAAQFRYNSVRPNIHGEVIFSYKSIFHPSNATMNQGVTQMLKNYWKQKVPTPIISR